MDSNQKIERAAKKHGIAVTALAGGIVMLVCVWPVRAQVNSTVINDEPLATRPNVQAKPNLLFVLDDSGSMNSSFMPDELGTPQLTSDDPHTDMYGYWSPQCNGTAYDPKQTYDPPDLAAPNAAGNKTYPDADPRSAFPDGFRRTGTGDNLLVAVSRSASSANLTPGSGSKTFTVTGSGLEVTTFPVGMTVAVTSTSGNGKMVGSVTAWNRSNGNLVVNVNTFSGTASKNWTVSRSSFYYRYKSSGKEEAMDWTYNSTGDSNKGSTFYKECTSKLGDTPGSSVFEIVPIPAAEEQNYANWYSYYRTRQLMMRTSVGKAFSGLNDSYRVGFTTINATSVEDTNARFQSVKLFDATQRAAVYKKLYEAPADGYTPLRAALSKAGRYFANKVGAAADPVEYSCQRNFTLLSTDGYWNNNNNNGRAFKVDGTASVGDRDGRGSGEKAPILDSTNTIDTLADVAQYYYTTRLRTKTGLGNCISTASGTTQDLCVEGYKGAETEADPMTYQNMKTYTVGMGVSGTLQYHPDYINQTTGDYAGLKSGTLSWPVPGDGKKAQNIDDLWHAAVNGRGRYYSAKNAGTLKAAIQGVIDDITPKEGSASAASTSALELVAGEDNQVYQARYTTSRWTGDISAYSLDDETAEIGSTVIWSAQNQLTLRKTARRIYYRKPGAGTLSEFTWTNLNGDELGENFNGLCSKVMKAMQCDSLGNNSAAANTGENLVNYLRGERRFETPDTTAGTTQALYRPRIGVLGDIVNGAPVYVGKPTFNYTDPGYTAYVASKKSRKPVIYAAANDGMLHAFSAKDGTELWAYVPRAVMPEMYRLADTGYSSRHRYLVDGAPVVGDIMIGSTWKTILVGGLNKGGRSYYALDITDPDSPKSLWEFSDTNLGLTFGNPVITKRKDGTWVVIFASGYNNNVGNADGKGRLYVLNANTGDNLLEIETTGGSATDPSGLAKINAWIDDPSDNTVKRVYGGDLQGGVWRFDIDSLVKPFEGAQLLARLQIDQSTPQPITTKPELLDADGKPVVIVGTGRYLSSADVASTTQQSVYALKDPLTNTGISDVRNNSTLVRQTFIVSGDTATISNNPVSWATKNGWWVDFPSEHSGERMAVDMGMQFGTLSIVTAIPASTDPCKPGGSSWRYYLNAINGNSLADPAGELWSGNSLIVGQSWVKLSNGKTRILRQGSDGTIRAEEPPGGGSDEGVLNRSSWRELTD